MADTTFTIGDDKKTLIVERDFAADRSKVWAAWTKPELFSQWWGPRGWSTEVKAFSFTEGGTNHYGMKCEDPAQSDWFGKYSWGLMTFHDIDAENSFAYTDKFADENAVITPGMPVTETKQDFIAKDGVTHVVSTTTFAKPEDLEQVIAMGMKEGLEQTWDRLAELLTDKA